MTHFDPPRPEERPSPESLELEARLDLLVDDELEETERAALLRTMDAAPQRWRDVALRFLTRQTERTAVRQLMGQSHATAARPGSRDQTPPTYPFPLRRWNAWGRVAALLVVAVLSGLTGAYGPWNTPNPAPGPGALATTATVHLPLRIAGTPEALTVQVPIVGQETSPDDELLAASLTGNGDEGSQHVVFTPQGNGQVLMFVVSRRHEEVIY